MTNGSPQLGAQRNWPFLVPVLAVAGAVYLKTLLPGIMSWGDVSKWQFIGRVLGIPHPTGYPLYIVLTHVFGLLPVGTLAMRINAFSAICTLGALAFFFLLLRGLGCSRATSAAAALALAFTPTLWSQSVHAEVYALNSLFVVAVACSFLRWRATGRERDLLLACGVYALSFGNHLTMILFLPALVYLVWSTRPRVVLSPRLLVSVLLLVLVGAGQYVYLFLRTHAGGPHLEYRIESLHDLVNYVTGERYRGKMFSLSLIDVLRNRVPYFLHLFRKELFVALLLAPVGMVAIEDRATRNFLVILFSSYMVFVLNYAIFDINVYCIPIYVVLVAWIAVGLTFAARRGRRLDWLPPSLLGVLAVGLLAANYNANDMSRETAFDRRTRELLATLDGRALVIMNGWWLDYGWFEGVLYRLLSEPEWQGRGLYVSDHLPPAAVRRYIEQGAPLRSVVMAKDIPRGLKIYTTSRLFMLDMQEEGLYTVRSAPELREVREVRAGSSTINIDFAAQQVVSSAASTPFDQPLSFQLAEQGVFWEHMALLSFNPRTPGAFTVRTPVIKAGHYKAEFAFAASARSGVVDVRLDGGTLVLQGLDLYSPSMRVVRTAAAVDVPQDGELRLTFEVVGRNTQSGGYSVGVDYLNLTPAP